MSRRPVIRGALLGLCILLAGCLVSPVERSGGPGSTTITNTNVRAVANASRDAFARHGFRPGPSGLPQWISFERPAGRTGRLLYGPIGNTAMRVRLTLVPIPGSNDIRVVPRVSSVRNAGRPGFEDETPMLIRSWAAQLRPVMREINAAASNAGPR